ncbi:type VI secretion system membrane-associated complex protein TssK [Dysgonomonas sp. 25]|uniref:type VI secretion system membrane-associated complex protein TssK n=1 Tax=Dysgonomonas sp. 25 TaxID=2302933 RepID=UPI0013D30A49|nr:type VI secretion system membrane-associated complex protein TssK [Dysgonomonas sp. 25]NDV69998.1 type VI secretion system membrane-associated complex protein TssK [Dysgonomonas sp. 25]
MQEKKHEYRLVNWTEAMDVNTAHLEQTENYFIDRLCDMQQTYLTSYNYGLLPSPNKLYDSSEFDISERVTGKVEIRLWRCNAITSEGCRISYNPPQDNYLLYTHSLDRDNNEKGGSDVQYWDVILTVDPYKRIPTGIPNEEIPPRHPDVSEYYQISIVPQGKNNNEQLGFYHLVIGRIRQRGEHFEVDTNYIPPCTCISSHSELLHYYECFGSYLNDIERASKLIIAKVRNRTQNSPIANHICSVCENMMSYIASIYFRYRNMGKDAAPVEIVNYFSTLSHICFSSLNYINKTEKEELLKYFYEWSDITPGSFEELLSGTLSIIYEHHGIRSVMLQVESFLRIISELWMKLSTLEYIGQHKENIIVSERVHQSTTSSAKGGWTILD